MSVPALALRNLLRAPPPLRPLLLTPHASYHSHEHPDPDPYPPTESAILAAALPHVPNHGFTPTSLRLGATDAGYLDITTNLFPSPAFALVTYHLTTQRLALASRVQFPAEEPAANPRDRLRTLILTRLRGNLEHPNILPRWPEALALMSLAENIPASLRELAFLSDEMLFLAGDTSVDSSWYSKRASLAAVYAAAEVFQSSGSGEREVEGFVERRLEERGRVGGFVSGVGEWVGGEARGVLDLARSLGWRV
ncbi:hypothetical protein B0A50_02600 [Salinomyces thailandicus]|uniref:Ubiquinone biosynthesis protein n=1 Tax=Salinomyces thailandicus TaxID=706561 RepID=A0A4U0U5G1_9PEZI|nr:hypothetical protein B0A50_02600 [Salinomyces thailandica]